MRFMARDMGVVLLIKHEAKPITLSCNMNTSTINCVKHSQPTFNDIEGLAWADGVPLVFHFIITASTSVVQLHASIASSLS